MVFSFESGLQINEKQIVFRNFSGTEKMADHSKNEAKGYALKLLSLRSHSRFELAGKMLKKGYRKELVEEVLDYLNQKQLIDDEAFAKELISSRSKRKPVGKRKMQFDLIRKGVPENIAEALLKEYDGAELCYRAGVRKAAALKGRDESERKKKLEVFLRNRGFEWPAIKETISRLFQTGPEYEND